jgi:hypothetical protein
MKTFFKSDWFKCISVLLALAIVLGGLLAVLSDVLYVSPEERTARAVQKIYGQAKEYSVVLDVDTNANHSKIEYTMGSINKIYEVGDTTSDSYDILFQTTGYEGYKNGTVTVWVQVIKSGEKYSIAKVVLESFDKQTLMSKLDGNFYSKFYIDVTKAYKDGTLFNSTNDNSSLVNPITGATKSAYAACCAVNCVIEYLGGMTNEN